MISLTSKIAKSEGVLSSKIDGQVVLMGTDSGKYFAFDAIGSVIWDKIDTFPVVADLCNTLAGEYEAQPAQILADLIALLTDLHEQALVSVS
jgi:hypothetical protein